MSTTRTATRPPDRARTRWAGKHAPALHLWKIVPILVVAPRVGTIVIPLSGVLPLMLVRKARALPRAVRTRLVQRYVGHGHVRNSGGGTRAPSLPQFFSHLYGSLGKTLWPRGSRIVACRYRVLIHVKRPHGQAVAVRSVWVRVPRVLHVDTVLIVALDHDARYVEEPALILRDEDSARGRRAPRRFRPGDRNSRLQEVLPCGVKRVEGSAFVISHCRRGTLRIGRRS